MKLKLSRTTMLIVVVFVIVLFWTGIAQKYGDPTVSMEMRDNFGWLFNTAPFIGGMLIGHWWVSLKSPIKRAFGWTLPFLGAYVAYDAVWYFAELDPGWYRWPILACVVGIVVGSLFWGQSHGRAPL